MALSSIIAVGVVSIVLGVVIRILAPRPRVRECVLTAAVALVGGELGVVLGAQTAVGEYQWIGGIVLGGVFAALTAAMLAWRRGPYPPHHTSPHPIDPVTHKYRGRPGT